MKFCSNCFNDTEIKNIINSINNTDVCDIHNVKSEHIYDTDKHDNLVPYFEALVDVYTVASESQIEIDKAKYVRLKYDLLYNWKIFNDVCKPENVHNIVKSICKEKYEESPSLFDNDIVIEELFDLEYKKEYSLLKTYSWDDFKTSLIKNNRYHTNIFNKKLFEQYCWAAPKFYSAGTKFYRGRISDKNGYSLEDMGCPPLKNSKAGRVNAEGVECLYLANNIETTINEVRAGVADYVTIATFELQKDIIIADLKNINKISPFSIPDANFLVNYAINKEHLSKINEEMSKVVRLSDTKLDYVPTQYICDFIKTLERDGSSNEVVRFAGVEYDSTLSSNGYNIAIFDPTLFKATNIEIRQINSLKYESTKIM